MPRPQQIPMMRLETRLPGPIYDAAYVLAGRRGMSLAALLAWLIERELERDG